MNYTNTMIRIFLVCACLLWACNTDKDKIVGHDKAPMDPKLQKGEELFRTHCITCHTLRYIDMQPDFPRKTWEKITDKMIKSFGAPIPDSAAVKIVDYLMFIKGSEE